MNASFFVLSDGWIPVTTLDGRQLVLGIWDTLEQAVRLKEISVVSPLEEYGLYRFLCVFLMDALRPNRLADVEELLERGSFDMERIGQYIALCQSEGVSFDLFDEARPFLQSAHMPQWDRKTKPVSELDCFQPSGNNHTHFVHGKRGESAVSVPKAARLLLALQLFCLSGAQKYPSGVNGAPPYFGVVKGGNLFETLVYTLQPLNTIGIPFDDPPVLWRETVPVEPKRQVGQTSWLRGMLFPARRVRLIPSEDGQMVAWVYLCQGENFVNKGAWRDPFVSYRTWREGWFPLRPSRGAPLWRNLYDILDIPGNHASRVLGQYVWLTDREFANMTLYGVETKQTSYRGVYREELRFPTKITRREDALALVKKAVESAEHLADVLRRTLNPGKILPKAVAEDAAGRFYQLCEGLLWQLCEYAVRENREVLTAVYQNWCEEIGAAAMLAHQETMQNLRFHGRDLAILADGQGRLIREIRKMKEEAEP